MKFYDDDNSTTAGPRPKRHPSAAGGPSGLTLSHGDPPQPGAVTGPVSCGGTGSRGRSAAAPLAPSRTRMIMSSARPRPGTANLKSRLSMCQARIMLGTWKSRYTTMFDEKNLTVLVTIARN